MRTQNFFVGMFSLILGIAIIFFSRNMPMFDENGILGERFWPYALAWLFIGLGIIQWLSIYFQRSAANREKADLSSYPVRKAYGVAALMVIYAVALCYAGFIVSSLILIPAIMWVMGERRPLFLAITTALIVLCIYISFEVVFNSPLPESIFSESF
ncbi:tripartite tricarboxylate transporter TctB family protein [Buttiauxella warmboldiae]|uniref:Tripartite tricarboxylate transporter TctB family protein n=1 Tax=Buttiauxella warmboldiae TaxID=82993 RepID=A0A3N5E8N6_9ENTR|nr:tripartite tricarboxylate transporter TctB family protein [Buttiauxella warmboldiae]RPH28533.1 tripartite tricarboxylate transporter TctB family protein [Buttiauxella warmboldiae]